MAEVAPLEGTKVPLLRRRSVAKDTVELTFDRSGGPFAFTAGQYVTLVADSALGIDPPSDLRDLSISSAPDAPGELSVAYRESDSPVKRWLRGLTPGTDVKLRGPLGHFTLPDDGAPVAMVAGGIGVAPFRSMLLDSATDRQTGLFCWNVSTERVPYADELSRLTAGRRRDLSLHEGLFEPGPLASWRNAHPGSHWYISGPSEMVWNVLAALEQLGVPKDRVRTEEFTGYEDRPEG
ncbi:MAG TPA: FAD-dependent oxidoreductase [Patescibacteria group bacterium]